MKKNIIRWILTYIVAIVIYLSSNQPVYAYWVAEHEYDINAALNNGWQTEEETMMSIRDGDAQPYQVEYLLDNGHLTAYVEELRAGGWISADYGVSVASKPVKETPVVKAEPPTYTVTDMKKTMYVINQVNVRNGAATDYEKIGSLNRNEKVTVTGIASTGWYEIDYNGTVGYVSDKYLTEVEPQKEVETNDGVVTKVSENAVLPPVVGHDYDELNDDAQKALMYFTADEEMDNAYLNIKNMAEDKTISGKYLNYTGENKEKGKINFVAEDGSVSYSYDFGEYTIDAKTDIDLSLDVSESTLTFKADTILPQSVTVTIKMEKAEYDYNLYLDGTLFKTVTSDKDGVIAFETDTLKAYEVKETLVKGKETVAVSGNVTEPVISESVENKNVSIIVKSSIIAAIYTFIVVAIVKKLKGCKSDKKN